MKIFNIDANSKENYMVNIIPNCGKSGDILKLNFVCIDFPVLNISDESSIDLQTMSTTISWKLSYLKDSDTLSLLPKKEFSISTISSNTIENYYTDKTEFDSSLEESDIVFEDKNKILKFTASTIENEEFYKTTIFINNKPVIVDEDKNFIDYKISKDKRLIYEAEIDNNNLNDTNIIYTVSIKLDNTIDNWKS